MAIEGINIQGSDWIAIKRWVADEIGRSQAALEDQVPMDLTQFHRGRVDALRALLAAAEPITLTPKPEPDNGTPYA